MKQPPATNLDDAWINFDPFTPLPAGSDFYVDRPGRPLRDLKRALLRANRLPTPPKYFFSGHRGAGKSTEINRQDIIKAAAELRSDFRRMLNNKDIEVLQQVHNSQELANPDELAPLLYISAAVEYMNDENWVDVHPLVLPLLGQLAS